MTPKDIRKIFRDEYNGAANCMTPQIIRYGKRGNFLYELSKGKGIISDTIYGVTVLELENGIPRRRHDLCEGFSKPISAENYIDGLEDKEQVQ